MICIIVPVYNSISTLKKCVQAILAQTIDNWELLLVDDGSTDGSGTLCDTLAVLDSRIRVFHKPNGGVSSARNLGLEQATGDYVMFCDSDDWMEPTWCEKLLQIIEAHPNSFPVCNYFRTTLAGESVNHSTQCDIHNIEIRREDFFSLNRQELLGIPWNKIFRRDILEKNRIRFRQDISLGEDMIFNLDYLHSIEGDFILVNNPLCHYFLGNTNSLSSKYYSNLAEIYQIVYNRIRQELEWIPSAWETWSWLYYQSRFYTFDRIFRNTFSKKNRDSCLQKWRFCAAQFQEVEFQECRRVLLSGSMNILQRFGLQSNSFYLYWVTVMVSEYISRLSHHY